MPRKLIKMTYIPFGIWINILTKSSITFLQKKRRKDYLAFKMDMSYTAVSEGKKSHGTWLLNTNGKYIELLSGEGKKEKLYIYFLSNRSLVVAYDTDKYRLWEVHYVSLNRVGK